MIMCFQTVVHFYFRLLNRFTVRYNYYLFKIKNMKQIKLFLAISIMLLITQTSDAVQLGGVNSPCWNNYLNCRAFGTSNSICSAAYFACCDTQGYNWIPRAVNTSGNITNTISYTPGQSVDFKVKISVPCCGALNYPNGATQPTTVTYYEIAKTDLFATTTSYQTANWTVIGQGTFSAADSSWHLLWTVPLNAPPAGYEIAVKMDSPSLPNGFVISSFEAVNMNSIPTLSEWALIMFAGLLVLFGFYHIQRNKRFNIA